jgi:hypothetical protein
MARTVETIYNEIIAKKDSYAELTDLNSTSATAIYKLWAYVVAFAIFAHEKINDFFKEEVQDLVASKQAPTLRWYQQISKDYLHGKPLVWNEDSLKWEQQLATGEIASDFQLVQYAAAVKAPGKVRVKVAKQTNDLPDPLSTAEKAAFQAYMDLMQAAGDTVEVISNTPDDLQITIDVKVDASVIDVSTGALHTDSGSKPVEIAINEYLNALEFNGEYVINKMIDKIQKAEGVINPGEFTIKSRYGALPFTDVAVSLVANSGYFVIDSLTVNYTN